MADIKKPKVKELINDLATVIDLLATDMPAASVRQRADKESVKTMIKEIKKRAKELTE